MIKISFAAIILLIISYIWVKPVITEYKRQQIAQQNFPVYWVSILEQNVYLYRNLAYNIRQELHKLILVFLKEKQFIGCGGLQITDEIKITIAAQACLLLLSKRSNYYSYLDSILVYPSIFVVQRNKPFLEHYLEEQEILSGESWGKQGLVVLAYDQVLNEAKNYNQGHNVVLHEFAHQLDQEDGSMNGVPKLRNNQEYQEWAIIFREAYQQLCYEIETGIATKINQYAITNPAEFFAVMTEIYFTQPQILQNQYPLVYQQLKNYYKIEITTL
jgi:Mlc titration factor MtfA (ptsG expression regulator)